MLTFTGLSNDSSSLDDTIHYDGIVEMWCNNIIVQKLHQWQSASASDRIPVVQICKFAQILKITSTSQMMCYTVACT